MRAALRPKMSDQSAMGALPVFGGSGVLPGIDLGGTQTMLDEMDVDEGVDAVR